MIVSVEILQAFPWSPWGMLRKGHVQHQQKILLYVSQYIAIYSNKILLKFEIQASKYLWIQATSKIQSTTKNVKFTIPATVCKGCMHCRDYKSMYLSAITADYVFLRSLVIDCREYSYIYVVTKIQWHPGLLAHLQLIEHMSNNKIYIISM